MKIYNTLTRKKEEFKPVESGKIKMYNCGPTVYNYIHIGNARNNIVFDVIRRYFEFLGFDVTYVQNITDIDDKLIEQSLKEKIPILEMAKKYIAAFNKDISKLGIKKLTHQPKATEYIGEMIALIKNLEDNGFAYEKKGDVYFSVTSYRDYGKLSGKKIEDQKTGARVAENVQKKHPADFTLWKKAKPGEPNWSSPWGKGRPGWHTECVVMSRKFLGETFDIHGGGNDLIFPHHENELAQAEAISRKPLANFWVHNGFIDLEGVKMSKSLGNFFTARDVLKKFDSETIRFFFLSKHYRNPIDFSEEILIESQQAVKNFYAILSEIDYLSFQNEIPEYAKEQMDLHKKFITAMDDDFNTAKAIAFLFEIVKLIRFSKQNDIENSKQYAHLLVELGSALGFFQNIEERLKTSLDSISEDLIELLIKYRTMFKQQQNWKLADMIREDLKKTGINLKDTKEGTDWSFEG